jgi:uncharacterized protein
MFQTPAGDRMVVIDAHVHLWDASPSNQRNRHGAEFINCFYDFHRLLSPPEYLWPLEKFQKYDPGTMYHDLFELGHVDIAICQPTYLTEFYRKGFNTTEQNAHMKELYPNRFILNGAFDPRDGDAGLEYLHSLVENYGIKGAKLYTGMARLIEGLQAVRPLGAALPRAMRRAWDKEYPRPQGSHNPSSESRRLRCAGC